MKAPSLSASSHYSYEQLADFVEGILSEKTSGEINAHLEVCELCQSIVAGIRYSKQQLGEDRDEWEAWSDTTEARQHKIIQAMTSPVKGKKQKILGFPTSRAIGMAASLLLAGIVGGYFYFTTPAPSPASRYLVVPYTSAGILRQGDGLSDLWQSIKAHYEAGNYELAGNHLHEVIEIQPDDAKAYFYRGLCYLYKSNPDYAGAISDFEQVMHTETPFYTEQARWFLALALHLKGDIPSSQKLLTEIARHPHHFRHREALKLLEK